MIVNYISFFLFQIITWPIRWLPLAAIHRFGTLLGTLAFYILPKFRKRTLSNLALASDLQLNPQHLKEIAKQSLQNLMITCLEYPKFASEKQIENIAHCCNPEQAMNLMQEGTPVIFFCGHQSNWEVLFLEGTSRMPGVAIGRPIKNHVLYQWVTSIREKYGGHMITPRNAVREGLKALKQGSFLGIVGDQGMPDSKFCCPFLGRRAWTSPLPAVLSHRTGSPIIVTTTRRSFGKYTIHYSDPIWPDREAPLDQEIDRMMKKALSFLEESIKKEPAQWLWSHNRWKQQTPEKIKAPFRQECLCIILPKDKFLFEKIAPHLHTFRTIYPFEFITIKVPRELAQELPSQQDIEIETYEEEEELFYPDFRFKLVFNFTPLKKLRSHYKKLAAFAVVDLKYLHRFSRGQHNCDHLSDLLKSALLYHQEMPSDCG